MRSLTRYLVAGLICSLLGTFMWASNAQTPTAEIGVHVVGDVQQEMLLSRADLLRLPQQQVLVDGKTYSGVLLWDVLMAARLAPASGLKNPTLSMYVVAKASDGYQALFSVPELDPAYGARRVLLAHSLDGQALPPASGPVRLVVPDDAKPSRAVFHLALLEVKAAR
ncbi:MAG: molybdopterin-dependent oxidoreductase [Curvibacter sp.]|nr:molybdopterin-dependent oxidoreductase [Curvibacter sp.]